MIHFEKFKCAEPNNHSYAEIYKCMGGARPAHASTNNGHITTMCLIKPLLMCSRAGSQNVIQKQE